MADKKLVSIEGIQNGVAIIVLNSPPVNSLSDALKAQLKAAYAEADANTEVKAMVITGAGRFFMAGADIPSIAKTQAGLSPDDDTALKQFSAVLTQNNRFMYKIETGPKPVVAAINGPALGGGLELAMSCNARVALAKGTKFGLPEIKLGLFPGMGGTQRAPRLVGVQKAVKMMLTGKAINAKKALKDGLVDHLVKKPKDLLPTAIKLALAIAAGQAPRKQSLTFEGKLKTLDEDLLAIQGARIMTRGKTKLPHPFACLDAVEEGVKSGSVAGLRREAKNFPICVASPSGKGLVHTFLSSKVSSKVPGLPRKGSKVQTVAVLGGGTMGAGIIIALLMSGYNVVLKEINQKYLDGGVMRIIDQVNRVIKKRRMDPMALEYILRNLTTTLTYDAFKSVDMVIEAVIENVKLKQNIFKDLVAVTRPDCILCTNTSTIDINLCSELVKNDRHRFIGLHFFSPAHVMPLLEIIRTEHTSPLTIRTTLDMAKRIKKTPIVVGNCTGFTANRVFFPYGQAASLLVDLQVSPYDIDKALVKFGMPMGVFRMQDQVGLDVVTHVGENVAESFPDRVYESGLYDALIKAKRLGMKTGAGIYKYKRNRPSEDPEAIAPILAAAVAAAKAKGPIAPALGDNEMIEILLFPVVNESYRVIGEKHVLRDSDIDVASIMGYGFPPQTGGVVNWGKTKGLAYVANRLVYYSKYFGKMDPALASFFAPCEYLLAAAETQ